MNKKLVVRISGGLGNQLFQYATAKKLSLLSGYELYLDDKSSYHYSAGYDRSISLYNFSISSFKIASSKDCYIGLPGRIKRRYILLLEKYKAISHKMYIQELDNGNYSDFLYSDKLNELIYLEGYWQSEKYFEGIFADLIKEFKLRKSISTQVKRIQKQIFGNEIAIAIQLRRKYSLDANDLIKYDKDLLIKGIKYYKAKYKHCKFYIFSDDTSIFPEDFGLNKSEYFFVDRELQLRDYEALTLLSFCEHYIISFSTFAWWGAWLGQSSFKEVLYIPNDFTSKKVDYYPETWNNLNEV